jgi:hypothetical protein
MFLSGRPVCDDDRGIALVAPVDVNLIIRRHLKYNFMKNNNLHYNKIFFSSEKVCVHNKMQSLFKYVCKFNPTVFR